MLRAEGYGPLTKEYWRERPKSLGYYLFKAAESKRNLLCETWAELLVAAHNDAGDQELGLYHYILCW